MNSDRLESALVHLVNANSLLSEKAIVIANHHVLLLTSCAQTNENTKIPRYLCKAKVERYLELISDPEREIEFINNYRIDQAQFSWLMTKIPINKNQRWPKTVQTLMFLEWISSTITIRQIRRLYDMPKSTCHDAILKIRKEIVKLQSVLIRLPTIDECNKISNGFARKVDKNFLKNVVGAIDGSLINISVPENRADEYYDRHLNTSMNLTAICDNRMLFRFANVGRSGACHDANVFKESSIFKNSLYPPRGYCILGDSAYPNMLEPVALISPYKTTCTDEPLPEKQHFFNLCHSRLRNPIECAFGDLKSKWRRIAEKLDIHLEFIPDTIISALILNNISLLDVAELKRFDENSFMGQEIESDAVIDEAKRVILSFSNANEYRDYICDRINED